MEKDLEERKKRLQAKMFLAQALLLMLDKGDDFALVFPLQNIIAFWEMELEEIKLQLVIAREKKG